MLIQNKHLKVFPVLLAVLFVGIFAVAGYRYLNNSRAQTSVAMGRSAMFLGASQANNMGDTSRYKYVILQDYMFAKIPTIKAANPNTKVLAYKDMAATSSDCSADSHPPQGVSYCDALSNHPDWFLRQGGQAFTFCDFNYLYWMDIGNAAYRQKWVDNVKASVTADGFDGVFMDDTNFYPGHCMGGDKLEKYTDAQYGQAMVTFANQVASAMKLAGLLAVANIGADPWTASQENLAMQVAPNLTAFFREHFMHWQSTTPGRFTGATWLSDITEMETVEAKTAYLANTYPDSPTDTQTMRYGMASFLLAWSGRADSAFQIRPDSNGDPYNPAIDRDVGVPTAPRFKNGIAWQRNFTKGTVIVNPDPTQQAAVNLSATYLNQANQPVTSVTVGPGDAVILTSQAGTSNAYDLNGDGRVDNADLNILLGYWRTPTHPNGDFNNDGIINAADLSLLLSHY